LLLGRQMQRLSGGAFEDQLSLDIQLTYFLIRGETLLQNKNDLMKSDARSLFINFHMFREADHKALDPLPNEKRIKV